MAWSSIRPIRIAAPSILDCINVCLGLYPRPVRLAIPSSPDLTPPEFALRAGVEDDSDAEGAYKNAYKSLPVMLSI